MTQRIIVIANCHSLSIARALSLGAVDVDVGFVDLNFIERENEVSRIDEIITGLPSDAVVFSFVCSQRLKPFSTESLESILGRQLLTFTNVRFDGLHPDMTYIGPFENRKHSSMGVYHSKLVLYAYSQGYSTRDCARLFTFCNYEKLGYFNIFDQSAILLQDRDRLCDVRFASRLLSEIKFNHWLYTFNHLTGAAFQTLAEQLCEAGGIRFINFGHHCSTNELSTGQIWPIYNEVAEYHRLSYRVPQQFVRPQSFESRVMTLAQMIQGSYDVYSQHYGVKLKEMIKLEPYFARFQEHLG